MSQDVDQASERIADVERRHAPRLGFGAALDLQAFRRLKDVGVER